MILRIVAGVSLVLGIAGLLGFLHLIGKGPFASLEMRHLREMKDRVEIPAAYDSVGFDDFAELPHHWSVAEYSGLERRAVSLEGYVQRILRASDGDIHLEIVPEPPPRGELVMYVTGEITPGISRGSQRWSYTGIANALRPDFGATTPWEDGPRRARIKGWLLYDFQYDDSLGEWSGDFHPPRATGWEIHPVTAIDLWSDSLGFMEYTR